ncbi:MAG: flagellar basal body L-ring protein FlgH [Proteobacteria bacterium]|nr:flagellar basal body L-ring protein FlgH [Pseudomonadota bacterium]MBU1737195.1 flagellar basal body L-ring protein FlgH [Pseudomonadota bacterium]
MKKRILLAGGVVFLLLNGCVAVSGENSKSAPRTELPPTYIMPGAEKPLPVVREGAIFRTGTGMDLYSDSRARRIGDLVMVKIVETSSGSKKATTTTERKSTVSGGVTSLFGIEKWLGERNSRFTPSATSLQAGLTNDFEGTGETKRNSNVTATITARVMDITVDDNLLIRGFREIRVNNETQHIILSGLIRPADIAEDNSILSSHISDARIEYSGSGIISEKQQPGWLARTFDVVWPF